ncbi:SulP family inorganic anion transporter [Trujillonella endophytica]|uniref:High affinity sulphate transporter 1 n=1 Tax=Trujillonella endophytica TaxID=673521 RepID=A0A1H8QN85_9ACTN|nr:sulfate permease [Trujillella endophytica]SEO55427.1 high affinity sulphate transporter 1 [Trujillella endophytica]
MSLVPPGFRVAATYRRAWLVKDLTAGVVLTTLLVPQGMAYAELAGLPPITGLYTSIMCLLGYALVGPSRILVLGPDSSLGPMIAATVLPLVAADGDPQRAVVLASLLAVMVAAIMLVAGVAKLGFIAELISKPTMIGYLNGLALTILIGQLPKLLGFSVDADGLIEEVADFGRGLADGAVVPAAAAVGLGGIALVLALQRWLPKVPAVLVMVVLAIAVSSIAGLGDHGVSLIGTLPQGFPPLSIPTVPWADVLPLAAGALAIAVVSLADTISTSTAFAERTGQEVRGNAEMIGIGTANLAAGLFQGFPVSTSASRTAVAERAGARTQLTGVTGAVLIVILIVALPGLFRNLPQPALAAVVITASLSLADIPGTVRLWKQRRVEFSLSLVAFAGVALLGVLPGIGIAVGLSILNVFRRAWRPYQTTLGLVDDMRGYHDVRSYPTARLLPGLVIFRFDAPLFFANAKTFRDEVVAISRAEPAPEWIVVAAEPITDVDTTAADVLFELDHLLDERGQSLVFAGLKDPVRRKIDGYGLTEKIEPRHLFPTVGSAVAEFRARRHAEWAPAPTAVPGDRSAMTPGPGG